MEWQPIETAPKDGTPILGFADGKQAIVEWLEYWKLCVWGSFADDGKWWPTHWMPLPPPPGECMTDRELLELAAKAAGIVDAQWEEMRGWGETRYGYSEAMWSDSLYDSNGSGYWNPLTDDGDALRLAVRLGIDVMQRRTDPAEVWAQAPMQRTVIEPAGLDRESATRRAIVRAAAEMAK